MSDDEDDLFQWADDICRNHHGGNPESEAAFANGAQFSFARDRARILGHLRQVGRTGDTCDAIEVALGLTHQTASARCSELLRAKLIRRKPCSDDSTKYERRLTRTGHLAAVLIYKP